MRFQISEPSVLVTVQSSAVLPGKQQLLAAAARVCSGVERCESASLYIVFLKMCNAARVVKVVAKHYEELYLFLEELRNCVCLVFEVFF